MQKPAPVRAPAAAELALREAQNLASALAGAGVQEAFMTAVSPATLQILPNEYYKTREDYTWALAEAIREEYKAIVDAGFILQIDDPALVDIYDWWFSLHDDIDRYRKWAAFQVEAVNHALEGVPEDRVRFHICWGSWHGPHKGDVQLKDVADLLIFPRALVFLGAATASLSPLIASRPFFVMRSAIGPLSSSRRKTGSEPAARTSSSRPARMSLSIAFRAASPLIFAGISTPRSSRRDAVDRMTSYVSVSFDIGILRWGCGGVVAATTTAPPWPCSRSRGAPGARNGHTTALVADECQSFLDNVIAGLEQIGSWSDRHLAFCCAPDRDAAHDQTFRDRVHAMGIEEVITAPRSPWQKRLC